MANQILEVVLSSTIRFANVMRFRICQSYLLLLIIEYLKLCTWLIYSHMWCQRNCKDEQPSYNNKLLNNDLCLPFHGVQKTGVQLPHPQFCYRLFNGGRGQKNMCIFEKCLCGPTSVMWSDKDFIEPPLMESKQASSYQSLVSIVPLNLWKQHQLHDIIALHTDSL